MAKINRRLILTVLLSFCRSKGSKAPSDGLSPPIQPLVEFLSPPPRQKKKPALLCVKPVLYGWDGKICPVCGRASSRRLPKANMGS
ncbi:MAG TPA: hypothetical protein IAB37_02780 [Candidatus Faecivivens stercoravium]|uniref:Uncharacterized protein n=1 Tax=Candidatus Faecivivens stercoravium TaxID=2840803 RepID=A0A9D1J4U7_9FIRM|nr:hypothetical protein [Candidatus Faecivivens stercoravium]